MHWPALLEQILADESYFTVVLIGLFVLLSGLIIAIEGLSMSDRSFWEVSHDSPVMAAIDRFHKEDEAVWQSWKAFAAKYGTDKMCCSRYFYGLVFEDGKLPENWITLKAGYSKPNTRRKAGNAINTEMRKLHTRPDGQTFTWYLEEALGIKDDNNRNPEAPGRYTIWKGNTLAWTTFIKDGNRFFLNVPAACRVSPPGCREMLPSEFYALDFMQDKQDAGIQEG